NGRTSNISITSLQSTQNLSPGSPVGTCNSSTSNESILEIPYSQYQEYEQIFREAYPNKRKRSSKDKKTGRTGSTTIYHETEENNTIAISASGDLKLGIMLIAVPNQIAPGELIVQAFRLSEDWGYEAV